ncbi:BH3 interacting domain death agonist [Chaetodon trifascialis]|uniref:BH3 interacting domain death agonist n=1 Tax=Chaetodon trifascialis TaxID=109706 RepID=UPI003996B9B1
MDDLRNLTSGQNTALVILAFLQADCRDSEYGQELFSLRQEINIGLRKEPLDDGDLETDGHLPRCFTVSLDHIQPSVEPQRPGNHANAAALQQVAEELREIAAGLEHSVVFRATQNLSRNIRTSPSEEWKHHLSWEVDRVMQQGVNLKDLPRERVIVALTLTLVKGVCEQAPRLLRSLFSIALQYIGPVGAR